MSNSKRRGSPARSTTLAALSLAALAAAAPQANAAITRSHFQEEVEIQCSPTTCYATFTDLPANQALEIDHVVCKIVTKGYVYSGEFIFFPTPPRFSMPLNLLWQRSHLTYRHYTLGMDMNMRVPLGRQARVIIDHAGGPETGITGDCYATGERLTTS